MNKYHRSEFRKHYVRGAGQVSKMKPKAEAKLVKRLSQKQFRSGVFGFDTCHDPRTDLVRNRVHQIDRNCFVGQAFVRGCE